MEPDQVYHVGQLVNTIAAVVGLHVHILCTKVAPWSKLCCCKLKFYNQSSQPLWLSNTLQCTNTWKPGTKTGPRSSSSLWLSPTLTRKARLLFPSQIFTFFSCSSLDEVQPLMNQNSSSAQTPEPYLKNMFIVQIWFYIIMRQFHGTQCFLPRILLCELEVKKNFTMGRKRLFH